MKFFKYFDLYRGFYLCIMYEHEQIHSFLILVYNYNNLMRREQKRGGNTLKEHTMRQPKLQPDCKYLL